MYWDKGDTTTRTYGHFYTTEYIIESRLNYEYSLRTWGQIQIHSLRKNKHRGGSSSSAGCPGENLGGILAEKTPSDRNYESDIRLYTVTSRPTLARRVTFSVKKKQKKTTMLDYWAVFVMILLKLLHQSLDLLSITEKPSGCACLRHCRLTCLNVNAQAGSVCLCSCLLLQYVVTPPTTNLVSVRRRSQLLM